jgi:hypothetical protein
MGVRQGPMAGSDTLGSGAVVLTAELRLEPNGLKEFIS